ncbi:MAG TPA: tRNA (adenosine(37)-N6)-threonylcarbamoyltransferase complex dimerization subunit type 1 TsaB [Dehalococcoidia bacterium]
MAELSIDTASEIAGIALTSEGALLAEVTWRARQNHSRELLPSLEWLLARAGLSKADLSAVFVCTGPGSYAGLRVGLSTAKTLAFALGLPVVGVGRLAADASALTAPEGLSIVAVHAAGRAELAWASYARSGGELHELSPPRLVSREEFVTALQRGDVVCGEPDVALCEELAAHGVASATGQASRALAVAKLGWERLRRGEIDSTDALVPLYLREPAIGPQPPARP